ncbi:MAG TPA: sterol desaturase family protein [Saprospiraceae bacterium]|nr:sterol desaturase family protein [Saprospiraceae bacterium]
MFNLLIILSTYISMEAATWTIHKYVMHGFLWFLHRDHHDHSTKGAFEKNDWFFIIFAIPAILLIYMGVSTTFSKLLYIGLGITLYGFSYFFVHDIFIHQRLKVLQQTKNPYLKAIRRAHKQHHKHISKENGECFGFLWVPIKYFKLYFK